MGRPAALSSSPPSPPARCRRARRPPRRAASTSRCRRRAPRPPPATGRPAAPPPGPLAPPSLTVAGARIFMLDHDSQLWSSDGTAAGTALASSDCCLLPGLVALGGKVFFKAASTAGTLLFSSD